MKNRGNKGMNQNTQKTETLAAPKQRVARQERVSLGTFRTKLHIPEDQLDLANYNYRWIRDTGARVAQAERAGYVFVKDDGTIQVGEKEGNTDIGGKISVIGGDDDRQHDGAYRMYLMRQPIDFYNEDQAVKQQRNEGIQNQIKGNLEGDKVEGSYKPGESKYVP